MTSIPDCLAIFSVSALANDENAVANAREATDRFVAARSNHPSGALAALYELRAAFMDLRLDCTAGIAILAILNERIGGFSPDAAR
jgi:predicted dinucleotide-utilizing enzyme